MKLCVALMRGMLTFCERSVLPTHRGFAWPDDPLSIGVRQAVSRGFREKDVQQMESNMTFE
jgi:hypothetical protein